MEDLNFQAVRELTENELDSIRDGLYAEEPFVLRGVGNKWPAIDWTIGHLKKACGNSLVNPFRHNPSLKKSYLTQAMESYSSMTASEFLSVFQQEKLAILDCDQIFRDAPNMLEELDFDSVCFYEEAQKAEKNYYFFISHAGFITGLHLDCVKWAMLFQISGRKEWILFPPTDKSKLYIENNTAIEGGIFCHADPFHFDYERFPLLKDTTPYGVSIVPGDLIYVPEGWWHSVRSVDDCISVACQLDEY